jgi:hypothetical protein
MVQKILHGYWITTTTLVRLSINKRLWVHTYLTMSSRNTTLQQHPTNTNKIAKAGLMFTTWSSDTWNHHNLRPLTTAGINELVPTNSTRTSWRAIKPGAQPTDSSGAARSWFLFTQEIVFWAFRRLPGVVDGYILITLPDSFPILPFPFHGLCTRLYCIQQYIILYWFYFCWFI